MEATKIRWATSTWNFATGCTEVSPGCDHCYARTIAEKFGPPAFPNRFAPTWKANKLGQPRSWRDPRIVFVNSMSDLWHPAFGFGQLDEALEIMAEVDRHEYLILTKRPARAADHLNRWLENSGRDALPANIWLGTSIENNRYAWRADHLRRVPATVRFVSAEPLLGPLDALDLDGIAWLIVGGESGPGYRPMDLEWARDLRRRCAARGVAFYFKQSAAPRTEMGITLDGVTHEEYPTARLHAPALAGRQSPQAGAPRRSTGLSEANQGNLGL